MKTHVSNHLFKTDAYKLLQGYQPSAFLATGVSTFGPEQSRQEDIEWLQEIIEQDEAEEVQLLEAGGSDHPQGGDQKPVINDVIIPINGL